jgi:hypothetical protein
MTTALMSRIPALWPFATLTQPNAAIVFKGENFPIIKERFTAYSRTAAEQDRPNLTEFVITSSVTRESVQTFVDVCQEKPWFLDRSQILDLLSLCEEWSVDSLKRYLLNVIESDDEQILTALRYAFARGFGTHEYEARARRRFPQLVGKGELIELPIEILRRIIDVGLQDTDFNKLFNFLRRCLNRFGSCGSILFEGVNLRHFSVSQLQELIDRRDFIWCYLSNKVCDTLSLCMSEMAKHCQRFESEHRDLNDLRSEYRRVVSDYELLKRDQDELLLHLSSVETSLASLPTFQSSVTVRLDLLESGSATKSEIGMNYALKSDVEMNYVTKSELQSNYVTKSEANNLEFRCASKSYVEEELNLLKKVIRKFVLIPDSPLNGIIHHLTMECGGTVHDRGVITITANKSSQVHMEI